MEKLRNNEVFSPQLAWRAHYKAKNKIEMEWWSKGMKKAASFPSLSLDALFSSPYAACLFVFLSLPILKTFGLLRLRMRAQRACLAKWELVTRHLADVGALSARSDKGFAGRAGCTLPFDFTFSKVFLVLSELTSSLSRLLSLSKLFNMHFQIFLSYSMAHDFNLLDIALKYLLRGIDKPISS